MSLRIALFGQAPVAVDCLDRLLADGHTLAGVFAPPDTGRPDPLAQRAKQLGLPLFQRRYFQTREGRPIAAAVAEHRSLGADLNVMASLTSFVPAEICDAPRFRSICFHPSLLPRYRGGNALQWQIIHGERETGVSIFVPDRGVDTGPIVVQRGGVEIASRDTTATLFFEKLAPLGAEALAEAVRAIDAGRAEPRVQDETLASFQGLVDEAAAGIDLGRPGADIDRLVRGCDPQPGAWLRWKGAPLRLFGVELGPPDGGLPGQVLAIDAQGLRLALRGATLLVSRVRSDGAKEPAAEVARRMALQPGDVLESA
jgi:methionyl-tRNA formyltransferase